MSEIDQADSLVAGEATNRKLKLWPWPLPIWTGLGGIAIGAIAVIAFTGITSSIGSATAEIFQPVLTACGMSDDGDSRIGDGGNSLTINGKGNDDATGISVNDFVCVMTELETPDSVVSHVSQTTSLDGRQTERWSNLSMSWSYHPDRGADVIYTVIK